jgi:DNA uptake protein ComE-like DNA-binding protein
MENSRKRFSSLYLRRGSLVVVSIWVLVIFTILSVGLYRLVSSRIIITKRLRAKILSRPVVKGVCLYIQEERRKDETPYDTLYELEKIGEEQLGEIGVEINIIDEESKININKAPSDVIASLPGLNEEIAKEIKDFSPQPFYVKEELLLVEGLTQEMFLEINDFVTVHGEGKVNINTAQLGVFKALGFDADLARIIEDFRRGPDGKIGTEDDEAFKDTHTIASDLDSFASLSDAQKKIISKRVSEGLLGVSSKYYLVQVKTKFFGTEQKFRVVLSKEGIEEWREY